MKKILFLIATALVFTLAVSAKPWATGIPQDKSEAINFLDKEVHIAFMETGKLFPINPKALYKDAKGVPMPMSAYANEAKNMQKIGNQSIVALFNALDLETGGQLKKDFNITSVTITLADVIKIFRSDAVIIAPISRSTYLIWDAYDRKTVSIDTIGRYAHVMPKSAEGAEYGFYLKISGYKPILIRSAYCGNNISSEWAIRHLEKDGDWGDNDNGDPEPEKVKPKPQAPPVPGVRNCPPAVKNCPSSSVGTVPGVNNGVGTGAVPGVNNTPGVYQNGFVPATPQYSTPQQSQQVKQKRPAGQKAADVLGGLLMIGVTTASVVQPFVR